AVVLVAVVAWASASPVVAPEPFPGPIATTYGGVVANVGRTPGGARASPLAQVNTGNVHKLAVAWTYRAGAPISEATPLKIGDTLYFCTLTNIIIALDAEHGTQRWRFDPRLATERPARFCRGVAYHL